MPIDSGIYNCQWHRIEMTLKSFPPGTRIEVKAFAYADKEQAPLSARDPRLVSSYAVVAPIQPPPEEISQELARRLPGTCESPQTKVEKKPRVDEFLIQSGIGQFLSVFVALRGDSFGTPVVEGLRVRYPRQSYIEYLPPLYSANEPMRVFLDAFLSIFQTEWDEFDQRVDESDAFLDPDAVPEGVAMKYLASWIGLELEGSWNGEQNRRLLRAVPKIYPRRGTLAALRDYLGVYLANLAGVQPETVATTAYPAIVEGFQERQYLMLSQSGGSTLGTAKPLWSDAVVRRLQLGGLAREGEVELVSTGDPEHDFFNYFAHRFRVYVPAVWVRTADEERLLRRAIEAEMPAHVKYDLCLVEAGLCVEIQSTVGLDTIIGEAASWHLPCEPEKQAPSLPTLNRLGQATVLSRRPGFRQAVLNAGARVGDWILD
jgi:phage tail-like protein